MASIHPRTYADGSTRYQVRWRLGGGRAGPGQSEQFDDETAAAAFKQAVDEHGQQWPPGWVKGQGYIAPETVQEDAYRFRAFALQSVEDRTDVEDFTRSDYVRILDTWIFPTFGECDVRSTEHFSKVTISRWLLRLQRTTFTRGKTADGKPKVRKMSPKTIRNIHGLLSSVLNEAVQHEPPLRARNPCDLSKLPRADDETEDDKEFLTPQEVAVLLGQFVRREDQLLVLVKYGTGLRWSEVTALQPRDIIRAEGRKPRLRVQRAWKRPGKGDDSGYRLGTPKSKRGRRTITITPTVLSALVEMGLGALGRDELFFTGEKGQRLHCSTFGDRWARAVKAAQAAGLDKEPTPHDLRHSHAAALISEGHSLTYVQRRLGHESIQTTSDLYGHLLPEADDDAMETIEAALGGGRPRLRALDGGGATVPAVGDGAASLSG